MPSTNTVAIEFLAKRESVTRKEVYMETFTVAAVQMNALRGDLEHNLALHERFTREAARAGARIVMFPELSVTAHLGDVTATDLAEPAGSGRIHNTIRDLAKQHDIIISYGFCEYAHGAYYNSQGLMGPDGLIGVQRKIHASGDEYFTFRMGRSLEVFDLGFCTIGTLICFDSNFFEAWRVLALKGAEVILLPHASRSARGKKLGIAKQKQVIREVLADTASNSVYAKANVVYAVYANQYGYNGHSTHGGGAYVISPNGEMLVQGEPKLSDLMITAEIDMAELRRIRAARPILKQRRPEVYGILTEMI